jgi:hypothetical protein
MKKTLRKLSLSRETLCTLENPALAQIGGAAKPARTTICNTAFTFCETNCDCTYTCPDLCLTTTPPILP